MADLAYNFSAQPRRAAPSISQIIVDYKARKRLEPVYRYTFTVQ